MGGACVRVQVSLAVGVRGRRLGSPLSRVVVSVRARVNFFIDTLSIFPFSRSAFFLYVICVGKFGGWIFVVFSFCSQIINYFSFSFYFLFLLSTPIYICVNECVSMYHLFSLFVSTVIGSPECFCAGVLGAG